MFADWHDHFAGIQVQLWGGEDADADETWLGIIDANLYYVTGAHMHAVGS